MNTLSSGKRTKTKPSETWPRKVSDSVTIYRRTTPNGKIGFMVAHYETGKRRFDSYADGDEAQKAAEKLADDLSSRDAVAATLTRDEAHAYAVAAGKLKCIQLKDGSTLQLDLVTAVTELVESVKITGDLSSLRKAAEYFAVHHKPTKKKRVAEVVAELLKIKEARGASPRYMQDLRVRLERFAKDCQKDTCNVTTADVQEWLDAQQVKAPSAQSYANYRRVLHLLFKFAVTRGYASNNPAAQVERLKVRSGDVEIFTPAEMTRLLAAAGPAFLPCLAIGAFAGLRSAEIERLEWSDIHLAEKFIVVGASKAKTAGRRIVPIHDNLAAWLAPYTDRKGQVWSGGHDEFYDAQQDTAAATAVEADEAKDIKAQDPLKWKSNALRHSYASYRFAQIADAGRVAGELGNSAAIVHKHYRELVKPADAEKWFSIRRDVPANVVQLKRATG